MLTKWGKRLLSACGYYNDKTIVPVIVGTGAQRYARTNIIYGVNSTNFVTAAPAISGTSAAGVVGFMLGSGNAPESEDSYWLESQYQGNDTGLTASCVFSTSYDAERDAAIGTRLITVTNTSSETKRIAELGTKSSVYTRANPNETTSSSVDNSPVLLDRTVLDEPIDIPPNGSATIEYVLTLDFSE